MQHNPATRNARIATAAALAAMVLVFAAPTAAADENDPTVHDDGSATAGPCAGVGPWQVPPDYYVDVDACLDPL